MIKVFVPHIVTRYNPARGKVVPALNFSDARRFGEVEFLLSEADYKADGFDEAVGRILTAVQRVEKDDFLIPAGDPSLIAICAAEIVRKNGALNLLRWERTKLTYTPYKVKF